MEPFKLPTAYYVPHNQIAANPAISGYFLMETAKKAARAATLATVATQKTGWFKRPKCRHIIFIVDTSLFIVILNSRI